MLCHTSSIYEFLSSEKAEFACAIFGARPSGVHDRSPCCQGNKTGDGFVR